MPFLRKIFDGLVEHDFRWASSLFKILFWWTSALFGIIVLFYLAYRMKGMLAAIPPVIQFACLFLTLLAALLIAAMFRERTRALAAYERFLAVFEDLKPTTERERAIGLPRDKIIAVRRKAGSLSGKPKEWWRALDDSLESYSSLSGEEGWFLTTPVAQCLVEEDLVDSFYQAGFHQAVPGILASLGLLATFVAILTALAGVTYNVRDPIRPVSGIDQLINGLSGKFLSSIIALLLGVIFTFFEKKVCDRQLRNGYDALIRRCKDVIPFLPPSRILLDIQRIALSRAGIVTGTERH